MALCGELTLASLRSHLAHGCGLRSVVVRISAAALLESLGQVRDLTERYQMGVDQQQPAPLPPFEKRSARNMPI